MLRLLLDEHLPRALAEQLRFQRPEIELFFLPDWEGGALLGASDSELLRCAFARNLTLLTYDRRTIAPLLKQWSESGSSHGGVIFISSRTLAPNDIGGLLQSLVRLWDEQRALDWTDRVVYLSKAE